MFSAIRSFIARGGSGVSGHFYPSRVESLADEFKRTVMRDFMFGGSALVGALTYYVKGYVPIYNAQQESVKIVDQAIKQIEQEQAIKQIEQAKASAGPEELK